MTGQQQLEMLRAETERTRATTDNLNANTSKTRTEIPWIAPTSAQHIQESQQHVVESTARTKEAQARTATMELMRVPELNKLLQETALKAQETKTEEQKTREATEAANVAKQLYGSRASEAATLAAQAATYYKNYYTTEQSQKVDQRDLEIQLMKSEAFQKIIKTTLENDYGRLKALSDLDWFKLLGPAIFNRTDTKDTAKVVPKK